jgi:anion-transporting  ArsA/GET3 family ATPase
MEKNNPLNQYNYETGVEIKKIIKMKKQNVIILDKLKQVEQLYNETIDSLFGQITIKEKNIENLNNIFIENSKHLKYIISNLM